MRGGGGSKIGKFMKQKSIKLTLLADYTRGLITTQLTEPRPSYVLENANLLGGGRVGGNDKNERKKNTFKILLVSMQNVKTSSPR